MFPQEVVSEVIRAVIRDAKPGVSLLTLEQLADTTMSIMGATSYNKGYHPKWAPTPFPSTLCLGVNDVIAHAIPTDYILKEGDLLHIDCGVRVGDLAGDAGITIPIGEISTKDKHLLKYAKRALYAGIDVIRAGVDIIDIGRAIEYEARSHGFVVNRSMRGHGIGKDMHEEPFIAHFEQDNREWDPKKKRYIETKLKDPVRLVAGQIICLEPMLTYKDDIGYIDKDGWTVRTRDGKKSAFFEAMIEVQDDGANILTTHFTR